MTDTPLPKRLRYAAVLCMMLGATMGLASANEVLLIGDLEAFKNQKVPSLPFGDPALMTKVGEAQLRARVAALESMATSRSILLSALSVFGAITFVAALRLWRPRGIPRAGLARMLGGTTVITAILRTIDGAQIAAINQRVGQAIARALSGTPEADVVQAWDSVMVGVAVVHTAVIVGALIALSLYFKSEAVQGQLSVGPKPG